MLSPLDKHNTITEQYFSIHSTWTMTSELPQIVPRPSSPFDTPRLILRPLQESDAEDMYAIRSHGEAMKWRHVLACSCCTASLLLTAPVQSNWPSGYRRR